MGEGRHREGLICSSDVVRLAALLGGASISTAIPQGWDARVTAVLAKLQHRLSPNTLEAAGRRMAQALPGVSATRSRSLAAAYMLMRAEEMWGRMRGVRRFGWNPRVEIDGVERVHAALARGRGAVIWGMRFSSSLAMKQAFWRANLPLTHLSSFRHGSPSSTRFGVGVVAPLSCRAENPYLSERVQIPADGSPRYLQRIQEQLRVNACVSIFGEHEGRVNVEAEVLGMTMRFAQGAPSVAWSVDAALLTARTLRTGPLAYRVVVDEEISVEKDLTRREFARRAVLEYAQRLESGIVEHPADWQGWLGR